jgi:hypothetical protein
VKTIRTDIVFEGQAYVDEPRYQEVSSPKPLAVAIAKALHSRVPQKIEELSHYERTRLRWMEPDGSGGLIPRSK